MCPFLIRNGINEEATILGRKFSKSEGYLHCSTTDPPTPMETFSYLSPEPQRRRLLVNQIFNKSSVSIIYKERLQLNKKQTTQLKIKQRT